MDWRYFAGDAWFGFLWCGVAGLRLILDVAAAEFCVLGDLVVFDGLTIVWFVTGQLLGFGWFGLGIVYPG